MELLRGNKPVAQIYRERGIRDNLLYKWHDAFLERAPGVFASNQCHDDGPGSADRRVGTDGRTTGGRERYLKKADSLLGQLRQKCGS